jgi:hypothetical protein
MKAYVGHEDKAPHILDHGNREKIVVSFMFQPPYLWGKNSHIQIHWIGGWVGPLAGSDMVTKRKIPAPASK